MVRHLRFVVCSLLVLAARSQAAETVGARSYSYIGPVDFDFAAVSAASKARLDWLGFDVKHNVRATAYNQDISIDVFDAITDYGGVLIYVGHGSVGKVSIASYEHTPEGYDMAMTRA